ncbi:MAG: tetratricopeptide repeat protein [Alphaproteobacteria bacterium]|nr:tetratricopeptide repeat protein [Alphaproteobacteria bacterium]
MSDQELAALDATIAEHRAKRAADPDALFPELADALMGRAAHLADHGDHEGAMEAAMEGVAHFRLLHQVDPGVFAIHLASALNNLSNRLSDLGRDDEARAAGDEAIRLARGEVDGQPDQARFVMISALLNQSGRAWRAGQALQALGEMKDAVEVFQEGGEAMSPFMGVMVDALHRNGLALAEAGRWEEAIMVRRMVADLFPKGEVPLPVHHLLGLTLQQAAFAKSRAGQPGEALPLVEEAAELARGLVDAVPDQYRLYLAQSLGNLASRQHEAGANAEALESAIAAVNSFQEAAQSQPGEALAPLVTTLDTFIAVLMALGHADQAESIIAQRDHLKEVLAEIRGGDHD